MVISFAACAVWSGGTLGTGTNFEDPTNWAGGVLPGPTNDAVIGAAFASQTITSAANVTIHSLTSEAAFQIAAGTFAVGTTVEVDNTFTINGGTLANATVERGSGGQGIVFTTSGGKLDAVDAACDLDLASNSGANVDIVNGLTLGNATVWLGNATGMSYGIFGMGYGSMYFDTTETLGGTGTVVFGKSGRN